MFVRNGKGNSYIYLVSIQQTALTWRSKTTGRIEEGGKGVSSPAVMSPSCRVPSLFSFFFPYSARNFVLVVVYKIKKWLDVPNRNVIVYTYIYKADALLFPSMSKTRCSGLGVVNVTQQQQVISSFFMYTHSLLCSIRGKITQQQSCCIRASWSKPLIYDYCFWLLINGATADVLLFIVSSLLRISNGCRNHNDEETIADWPSRHRRSRIRRRNQYIVECFHESINWIKMWPLT